MSQKVFNVDSIPAHFEKSAALSMSLASAPEDWDQEILEIAYKQHPWLAEFTATIDFIKKVPDRRYGLGGITVYAKIPAGVRVSKDGQGPTGPIIGHIPVIVREGELMPLDVFVSGTKVLPLDEDTFRRQASSVTSPNSTTGDRSDPTIIGYLWPPGRSTFGGASSELGMSLLNKFASAEADDFFKSLQKLAEDEVATLKEAEGFPLLTSILQGKVAGNRKAASDCLDSVKGSTFLSPVLGSMAESVVACFPDQKPARGKVAQLIRGENGYIMRTTYPEAFSFGRATPVNVKVATGDDAQVFVPEGFSCARVKTSSVEKSAFVSDLPPICGATIVDGSEVRAGAIFRDVVDFNGQKREGSLFTEKPDGSYSMGSFKVADMREASVPGADALEGRGVFVSKTAGGHVCSVPVTIHRKDVSATGPVYLATVHGTKLAGEVPLDLSVKLYVSNEIREPLFVAKTASLLVPAGHVWVKVASKQFTPYTPITVERNVVTVQKMASDLYSLSGKPVQDVVTGQLNSLDTQFVLASLGLPSDAIEKVMSDSKVATLVDCNVLKPRPAVSGIVQEDPELLKAAAYLDDPNTVDAVMGLNMADFNVEDDFQSVARALEDAQQRIARLLLLSRLGMYTIPEGASKVVMIRLTPIIDALKVMALQHSYGGQTA